MWAVNSFEYMFKFILYFFSLCVCCVCVRTLFSWQLKVPQSRRAKFSAFFFYFPLKATCLLLNMEYHLWAQIIHRCHQYFDMQSDIFCISTLVFLSPFLNFVYTMITRKHYYDYVASCRTERTHTHDISQGHIIDFIIILSVHDVLLLSLFPCNVCSFAIFFSSTASNNNCQWPYLTYNKTEFCSDFYNILHMIWYGALLGHKTRIVQCCYCCCCCWFFFYHIHVNQIVQNDWENENV